MYNHQQININFQQIANLWLKYCQNNLPNTNGELSLINNQNIYHQTLIAIHNNNIAGSLGPNKILDHLSNSHGKLDLFYIQKDKRNQHFGTKLLSTIMKHFKKRQAKYTIFKVETNNQSALSLYQKLGFQIIAKMDYLSYRKF
ncbi:MAG TPA: GNAT family N-acetyltransferase [bacterium]|nr:GNAT family N-acetyltransferase [bacterium]